jgi:2-oxoglutaroyl-CoA hydrolase
MKTAAPGNARNSAPAKRRAGAKKGSEPMSQSARRVAEPDPAPPEPVPTPPAPEPPARETASSEQAARPSQAAPRAPAKSDGLDGFRVEIDAARQRLDIVLDRPPLNVITMNQREQLRVAFEAADSDNRVRVIVVRAAGEHFSSGGEIQGFLDASAEHVSRLAWNIAAPARCRKPVVAASRGYCFGVGFELALACDFRLVTESTVYALPEQRLGMIPGSGGAARLQNMVGITRAKDIVMRSRRITGFRAFEWGIATDCVAEAELEKATDTLVEELCSFAPLAQRSAKKLLNDCEDASLSLAIELEGQAYGRLRGSDDFREGVEAFEAKRKPNFKGS